MSNVIDVEMRGRIAVLRFNRPDALNALTVALARGIADGLVALDADDTVDGIVLTGAGERAFCAGVDLAEAQAVRVAEIED